MPCKISKKDPVVYPKVYSDHKVLLFNRQLVHVIHLETRVEHRTIHKHVDAFGAT